MKIEEFLSIPIDSITATDVENAYFMMGLFDDCDMVKYEPKRTIALDEASVKALKFFDLYKSEDLEKKIREVTPTIYHLDMGVVPYNFKMQIFPTEDGELLPVMVCPKVLDTASYAFLGHEINHCLKDLNNANERKLRDRLAEVIPLFYELICASNEDNEDISKEILRRRQILMMLDKIEENEDSRRLQYFNSYYYALAMFSRYKKDKLMVLRMASRVLVGEISTLDMLNILNIYDKDFDKIVSRELYSIKEYILS